MPNHLPEAIEFVRNVLLAVERAPSVAMYAVDAAGRVVYWNSCCSKIFGLELDHVVGKELASLLGRPAGEEFLARLAAVWNGAQALPPCDWEIIGADGSRRWLSSSMFPLVHDDKVHLVFCTDVEVTDRRRSHLASQAFENGHDAILVADAAWRIVAVNPAYTRLTGRTIEDLAGALAPPWPSARHDDTFYASLRAEVLARKHWEGEVWSERPGGEPCPLWVTLTAMVGEGGAVNGYVIVLSDISARKREEEATRYLAEHDFLTGLPNRVLLLDRLQQGLAAARRQGMHMAVMFIDLDHFKPINDNHGHLVGDAVLKEVAARLLSCVRGADTVSRQGGDEFVVVLDSIDDGEDAAHAALNVMRAIEGIGQAGGVAINLSASIGISLYPNDGLDPDTLLHHADVAMYHAKQDGRQGYRFYSPEMNAHVHERLALEHALGKALAGRQFELDYMPAVHIATGQPTSVESLLRWRHPEQGRLLPHQFLTVAEESGLIVEIGKWVLREACRRARTWQSGRTPLRVSVNVAAAQLADPHFSDDVEEALAFAKLPPALLDLEIREAMVLAPGACAGDMLAQLRKRGVRLTLDNFGTGTASLAALRRCPFSRIKIDRSLVSEIGRSPADPAIVPAMIALGRSLNLTVLAEGVESESQVHILRQLGCDEYQGRLVPDLAKVLA